MRLPRTVPGPALLAAALVVESQPDTIAHGRQVERRHLRRVEHPFAIAHQQRKVQPPFMGGGQQAQTVAARTHDSHQVACVGVPFVGASVDQRRAGQHHGSDVTRIGDRGARQRIGAEQQFLPALERPGYRGGHRQQGLLLAFAQHRFHLARVLAAGPWQHQGGQRQQQ
jgi:hypothetical protein